MEHSGLHRQSNGKQLKQPVPLCSVAQWWSLSLRNQESFKQVYNVLSLLCKVFAMRLLENDFGSMLMKKTNLKILCLLKSFKKKFENFKGM